jgi:tetratricopeptide (TPR) repeat protein
MSAVRRSSFIALAALLPLAAACGDDHKPASESTVVTQSGAVTPATGGSPASKPGAVAIATRAPSSAVSSSYDDGEAAFRAGRYDEAATIFAAYSERKPDNVWGQYMHGLAAWKAGDLHEADAAFDRALGIDAHHMKSLLNSTRVLLELGRRREALDRVTLALETDSTNGDALRLLGRVQDELGDSDAAIDAYRRALTVNERDAWAMNNLGLVYIETGRAEEAVPPLARAVELRPTAPVFQNNLGIALERTGHVAEARKAFAAAVAADSGYGKAAASLERVNAAPDSGSTPVDLAAESQRFVIQIRTWSESAPVARDGGTVDDSVQVTDSVKVQGDSK